MCEPASLSLGPLSFISPSLSPLPFIHWYQLFSYSLSLCISLSFSRVFLSFISLYTESLTPPPFPISFILYMFSSCFLPLLSVSYLLKCILTNWEAKMVHEDVLLGFTRLENVIINRYIYYLSRISLCPPPSNNRNPYYVGFVWKVGKDQSASGEHM